MAPSPYQLAQRSGRDHLRTVLLDTASRLLIVDGPPALTMRRIAGEVGCSTTVLYTMFGGKRGLAEELYQEGFQRFRRRLESVPVDPDPLTHLFQLAHEYRASALAEPNYYRVMFAQAIPGYVPSRASMATAKSSFAVLVAAVYTCSEAGSFVPGDPIEIAEVLWASAHGVISLELTGHIAAEDAESRYRQVITAAANWFRPTHRP